MRRSRISWGVFFITSLVQPVNVTAIQSFETPYGTLAIRASTDYYPNNRIMPGIDPNSETYWYKLIESKTKRSHVFVVDASPNPIGTSPASIAQVCSSYAQMQYSEFIPRWTDAVEFELPGGALIRPISYLQGLVRGSYWVDVSPGLPEIELVHAASDSFVAVLHFPDVVYHFFRIDEHFDPAWWLDAVSFRLTITAISDVIKFEACISLNKPFYHHNVFPFVQIDCTGGDYSVKIDGVEKIEIESGWKPFIYLQTDDIGRTDLTKHGRTHDRWHDEGPYLSRSVSQIVDAPVFRITSDSFDVRLRLTTWDDVIYTDRYMDLFGVQFERNSLLFNYSQFASQRMSFVATPSYSGVGMGWIPVRLLPGRYVFVTEVTSKSFVATEAHTTNQGILSSRSNEDMVQLSEFKRLSKVLPRKLGWTERVKKRKGATSEVSQFHEEVLRHWLAQDWDDWRKGWLHREWVDWPHYWGRGSIASLASLAVLSKEVTHFHRSRFSEELENRSNSVIDKILEPESLQYSLSSKGSVRNIDFRLSLPWIAELLYWATMSPHRHDLVRIENVFTHLRKHLCEEADDSAGFSPSPSLEKYLRVCDAFSDIWIAFLAAKVGHDEPLVKASSLAIIKSLTADDISSSYPFIDWWHRPLVKETLLTLNQSSIREMGHELPKRPWYAITAKPTFTSLYDIVYVPYTTEGELNYDLLSEDGGMRPRDDSNRFVSLWYQWRIATRIE